MAKYVVDVPDEAVGFMDGEMSFFVEPKIKDERRRHYALRIDEEDISTYTESDRKDIEDKVWEFAWKIFSMNMGEYAEIFDNKGCPSDYGEAKSKYDAWKKSRSEICIGDELKDDGNIRAVVLDMRDEDYKSYEVFTENGVIDEWQEGIVVKTGRHFDEVESLLKKMEED